jgi:hypothetical protein
MDRAVGRLIAATWTGCLVPGNAERVRVTTMQPVFFERPEGPAITLRSTPRLANWNRSGETGAARLTRALGYSEHLTDPELAACSGPVALRFDVGLPRAVRLLDERDLDNYLLPLTAHLAARSPHPIVSVWGCKRYADETTLRIDTARPREEPAAGHGQEWAVTLTASAVGDRDHFKAGFRKEIRDLVADRLARSEPLPDGPVILEVGFVVGPNRNWLDLWWSTIDGLGPLLGQSPSQPEFHPRDGRIVDLGLHQTVDPGLDTDVVIGLRAKQGALEPALKI